MNKVRRNSTDRDILASARALRRAARRARELSRRTATPFYAMKDGKVVNLNLAGSKAGKRGSRRQSVRTEG